MSIEERVATIENVVGISIVSDAKTSDIDVNCVRSIAVKQGLSRVMKIPSSHLIKLKNFIETSDSRPLSEKITTVECLEDLIRRRVLLLQEFEKSLQHVLVCKDLTNSSSENDKLKLAMDEYYRLLNEWKAFNVELEEFREHYISVTSPLQSYLLHLEERVALLEAQREQS